LVNAGNFHPNEHAQVTLRVQNWGVPRATSNDYWEHDQVRSRRVTIGQAGAAVGGVGLVLIALGTFLPWFKSGSVLRDSYQSISIVRTIKIISGSPLERVLDAWTMTVPVVTLSIAVYAFGFRRSAATIAAIVAIFCGTIGAFAAIQSTGSEEAMLGLAGTGPTVTAIGGALALLGVIGVFAGQRVRATNIAGGEP
jgi:hypothetical protein